MSDGIEIHFDERRGHLELACEPDAFAAYREIARRQLADFPGISVDNVIEFNVVDTVRVMERRNAPQRRMWELVIWIIVALLTLVGAFAIVGVVAVFRRLAT